LTSQGKCEGAASIIAVSSWRKKKCKKRKYCREEYFLVDDGQNMLACFVCLPSSITEPSNECVDVASTEM
jgi:hypothetical protein